MRLLKSEKVLCREGSLTLTNKRLVQERCHWFAKVEKEIPLSRIDMVFFRSAVRWWLVVLGFLALFAGSRLIADCTSEMLQAAIGPQNTVIMVGILVFLFGSAMLLVAWFFRLERVEFCCSAQKICEDCSKLENFVEAVRQEIY
jgi:hypothetical protein